MCFRPPTIESDQENVCPKCGADLFVGAAKCPACGSEVAAAHTSAVPLPRSPQAPQAPKRPDPPAGA
ncbi:hypothetical protein [Raoultibacter timonensis]|uniref:hypothetical protein n=1 Tax=Raoultibacter timonensis TaxID=1907662 RepID=UPI000C85F0E0|nr:hypothetical protein [Raoultibacter timonensis]